MVVGRGAACRTTIGGEGRWPLTREVAETEA